MNFPTIDRSFFAGECFDAYRVLGAHPCRDDFGQEGWRFAVWAPGAVAVEICGGFDGWGPGVPMQKADTGVWSGFVPGLAEGELYKYRIHGKDGNTVMRADPYAFSTELRPGTASRLARMDFAFDDSSWMERRDKCRNLPLNIYELHAGSWKHKPNATREDGSDGWYNYRELARELIPWLLDHRFTHVELLPLAEHPFDGSWGYQITGFFAPTSRYGTPDELAAFINACHKQDIGVILDFVPVHFAVDAYGLKEFDGTPLYEYPAAAVGQSEWGSCNFMHSRGEIQCFIQSCADYWLRVFHVDGLRMDAVSRLIYWQGDPNRGVNGSTLEFLKGMNQGLQQRHPTALLIAEDSTNYPKVTAPVEYGGLGFDYKWDLGWMNDTLDYFKKTSEERKENLGKLTFSMMYAFSENYVLAYSHDEVVHGKRSMLDKMYGDYDQKFASLRALYGFQFAHPGKKLCFMGGEFGQFIEWNWQQELDWLLLAYPRHEQLRDYYRKLNKLYAATPAMYRVDKSWDGFRWLNVDDRDRSSVAFLRSSEKDESYLVCVCNFTPVRYDDFVIALPVAGTLHEVLNSDDERFGGGGVGNPRAIKTEKEPFLDMQYSAKLTLPPMASVMFSFKPRRKKNEKRIS